MTLRLKQLNLVALMFAFSVLSYFDRTIMSIAGPQIMKEFGMPATHMGAVYSAFILSYAVFMVPGGHLVDRLGPRWTLTLMGLSAALFTGLTPLGGRPGLGALIGVAPALIFIRLGLGAGTAPLYTSCARMCSSWIPVVHQARVQGLIIAGAPVGGAISPLVFSWMMLYLGWRIAFACAAAVTGALALIWFWYARDRPPGAAPTTYLHAPSTPWRALLTSRTLLLLSFAYFTVGYFDYIFFYWIYYYFGEVRHMGFGRSAQYTTILFVTMAVMMPLGGWISDRMTRAYGPLVGRRIAPLTGMVLCGALLFIGTVTPGAAATVTVMSLAIGFAGFSEGPFWAYVTEMAGEHVGAAGGILNTGANLGGFFAPVFTPWIASVAGWSWGLYSGTLMVFAGAVACYLAGPSRASRSQRSSARVQV
jgi:MFS family permease